MSTDVLK